MNGLNFKTMSHIAIRSSSPFRDTEAWRTSCCVSRSLNPVNGKSLQETGEGEVGRSQGMRPPSLSQEDSPSEALFPLHLKLPPEMSAGVLLSVE